MTNTYSTTVEVSRSELIRIFSQNILAEHQSVHSDIHEQFSVDVWLIYYSISLKDKLLI